MTASGFVTTEKIRSRVAYSVVQGSTKIAVASCEEEDVVSLQYLKFNILQSPVHYLHLFLLYYFHKIETGKKCNDPILKKLHLDQTLYKDTLID